MKRPLLIFALFLGFLVWDICPPAFGANTVTLKRTVNGLSYTFTIDSTNSPGDLCVDIDGYIYKTYVLTPVGTVNIDIMLSSDLRATYYDKFVDLAAASTNDFTTSATHACVQVDTCTGCAGTKVVIMVQNPIGNQYR